MDSNKMDRRLFLQTTAVAATTAAITTTAIDCGKGKPEKPPVETAKATPGAKPTPSATPTPAAPPAPAPTAAPAAAQATPTASGPLLPSEAAIDGPLVDKRPFKFGLIGCGSQALLNLLPAALRIAGVKITAVCDILPARAQAAQKLAGGQAKIYDDWKALLKEADMDGVIIATPLVFHRPMAEEAFKNGRHVFCEKTMAYSIDDCKAMLRAQMASGRILQIGHHLRYHPLYYFANLHYIINHPLLGKISNVHCQWNRNGTWRRPAEPMAGVDFKKWGYDDADHVINWRLYRKYSGGLMTELASHQLDVVNWFLGDQLPQTVVGVGKTDNKDGRTIFDNVHLIYEYPDGVVMTYESITTNAFSPFGEAYEMFQGEKGTLVMAHLSRYVGLFFIEPGVAEELWMPAAHRAPLESPNLTQPVYKNPIVLNGTPSPGSRIEKVANLVDVINVVNIPQAQATMSTYEIELRGFKRAVLDKVRPYCDGMVGLKSAIPALLGLEAMEKNQRVVMNPSYLDLSATAGTTATTATAATATTSTKAGP